MRLGWDVSFMPQFAGKVFGFEISWYLFVYRRERGKERPFCAFIGYYFTKFKNDNGIILLSTSDLTLTLFLT